jgi:hypothetical protein
MLNFDIQYNDWNRLNPKQAMEPFMQAACCTVMVNRKPGQAPTGEITRMSDAVFDGVYFFGGKN